MIPCRPGVLRGPGGYNEVLRPRRNSPPCGGTGRQAIKPRANSAAGFNDLIINRFSGRCSIPRQRGRWQPRPPGQKLADLPKKWATRIAAQRPKDSKGSERVGVGLAGADADGLVDRGDKNLAVADLPGLGGAADGFDDPLDLVGRHRDLDADLRQEVHRIFGAAIDLGMALLPAIALDLGDGHAVHADGQQRVAYVFELERLDDRYDELHGRILGRFLGTFPRRLVASNGRPLRQSTPPRRGYEWRLGGPCDQVPRDRVPSDFAFAVPNILRFAATSHGGACAYNQRRTLYDSLTGAKTIYLVHSCTATYCSRS